MKVLVIGAARSGVAISKLLNKHHYEVYLTDANEIKEKEELVSLGIKVFDLGHPDELKENKYEFIVKNPGIKYTVSFVKHFVNLGYFIYNEIDIANRFVNYNYGTITGTNGKTTTTSILEHLLKYKNPLNQACGNIGIPLSECALKNEENNLDIALEIAAFQLIGVKNLKSKVSTCTNLSPDHLDYFNNEEEYYKAKMIVYQNQDKDDYFILNLDDENIVKLATDIKCNIISFSLEKNADLMIKDNSIYYLNDKLFDINSLTLVGKHNLANAAMAACMAYIMGVNIELINEGIKTFKGVEHRIEFVNKINGITYYNDSKATNVESTIVALKSFDKPVILLAGGYDKKIKFDAIKDYQEKIKYLIAFGESKDLIKSVYPDTVICDNIEESLNIAEGLANIDDIVLLSPMCASYDQFKNYEERGVYFKQLLNKEGAKND